MSDVRVRNGGEYEGQVGTYAPGRQQRGAPKGGAVIFLRHEIYKNSVRDGHKRTNHVRKTVHILDVIIHQ